ncbi:MAG: DUF427 domain-containing protein [Pseudomonadota bacterium]
MSAAPPTESVWDYPRPPRLEPVPERLRAVFAGQTVAETTRGYRILETSHPPVYAFPPEDVAEVLQAVQGATWCEFKGRAQYWDLVVGARSAPRAAWSYPDPTPDFTAIANHLSFYASRLDEAWVGDERVRAQEGDFYGGWITSRVTGPFKGPPGTRFW